ncbi:MAG: sodium-dependent transporter [Lachnospiraceae bacterium]|nr:sodium-dependent transporter [Lachnospiraceae bacterium]
MKHKKRSNFSNKLGFVLAAAGSAVGLGNLWRFPYLAAKYGGGIFLLVYLILAVTFGFTIMIGEIAIGRKTGLSAIGAFEKLDKKYTFIGYLASIVPIIILPYYSVIGGWVIKYFVDFISGNSVKAAKDGHFEAFISNPTQPIICFFIFILITAIIVFLGVEKGVEKVSKILMPVLAILTVGIAIYTATLPGSIDGLLYYVKPNFNHFSIKTVVAAMGQLFYSMSLAMGIMITYGSYMKKDVKIESSVTQIEIFDTCIAFFAGMMIVPAVFVFNNGDSSAINAGPGLMFITLPKVFNSMNLGSVIGLLFFILVLFAALTSSISLMETIVSIIHDKLHIGRKKATLIIAIFTCIVALPSSLGFGIWSGITPLGMSFLDFFDFISNSILMPIVAMLTCFFIGFVIKTDAIAEEVKLNSSFKREKLFVIMTKYIAPVLLLIILVSSILNALGIVKI